MMRIPSIIASLWFLSASLAFASIPNSDFIRWSQSSASMSTEDVVRFFEKIPQDSSDFAWAIGEAAKRFYVTNQWPRFFGLAYYSRSYLPSTVSQNTRMLEILAAIRHCQWEMAESLITDGSRDSDESNQKQYSLLLNFLSLSQGLSTNPPGAEKMSWARKRYLWPVQRQLPKGLLPFRLFRNVTPLCPEQEKP